jgi:hypothetical protein
MKKIKEVNKVDVLSIHLWNIGTCQSHFKKGEWEEGE